MARKRIYLTLDCETATLPFANEIAKNEKEKKLIAIARPLIYDIGWIIHDSKGNVIDKKSFLISEIFSVPQIFNTAYYKDKRPLYLEKMRRREIQLKTWAEVTEILFNDLSTVDYACAANAMFDFKKAIPFTEQYAHHLYNDNYQEWEELQRKLCVEIARGAKNPPRGDFDPDNFNFKGIDFPIIDIWGVACESLIDNEAYKKMCLKNKMLSESGMFFKTSVEAVHRYLMRDYDFTEDHTATEDAEIEMKILCKALSRGKVSHGIITFPFRILGTTVDFLMNTTRGITREDFTVTIDVMEEKLETYKTSSSFSKQLEKAVDHLKFERDHRFGWGW